MAVDCPGLPAAFQGFRLAQVSDLHNATFGRDNARSLAALAQAKPEAILLTGDLADSRRTNLAVALSFARQAVAIAPVYYVPGNHEARLAQYAAFAAALEAAGVQVLANRAVPWYGRSQRIPIAGLADPGLAQRAGDPRPAEAILGDALAALRLSSQPFPLPLAHRPEWFPPVCRRGAALVFSGHAHGGQVRLPGIGGLFAPGQGLFPRYDGGSTAGGRPGWWSAGGWATASSPLRVGNRPEVVVATLHPAPQWKASSSTMLSTSTSRDSGTAYLQYRRQEMGCPSRAASMTPVTLAEAPMGWQSPPRCPSLWTRSR